MNIGPSISSRRWSSGAPLTTGSILEIFAAARLLRAALHAGTTGKPLRGKNLALLLDTPGGEMSALHRAALELGARVAETRFAHPMASAQDDLQALARMLGRMYDAIDCGTLAPAIVRQIELGAGVPVYDGLDRDDHPVRVVADLMTLVELRLPRALEASILFLGDPLTMRGGTFLSAARKIGFLVRLGQRRQAASNNATFVVDATRPQRWALHAPPDSPDEALRSEIHLRVMQTVLLDTIGRL